MNNLYTKVILSISLRALLTILSFASLTGCASLLTDNSPLEYSVTISGLKGDAILSPNPTYVIASKEKLSEDDLQFVEFAGYVERVLLKNQYQRLPLKDQKTADLVITLGYSISEPRDSTETIPIPVRGITGGTTTNIGTSSYFNPSYGVTGFSVASITRTVYKREISLEARVRTDTNSSRTPIAWKIDIKSEGTSGDLRSVFPVMVSHLSPYIGRDTKGLITLSIKENDPEIAYVKNIDLSLK